MFQIDWKQQKKKKKFQLPRSYICRRFYSVSEPPSVIDRLIPLFHQAKPVEDAQETEHKNK